MDHRVKEQVPRRESVYSMKMTLSESERQQFQKNLFWTLAKEFAGYVCEGYGKSDKDGAIWVGTNKGVGSLYNPGNVFSGNNFDAQKIIIQQDG